MAIAYAIALVIVSLINLNGVPSLGSSFDDKIYHIIAYIGLAFLWITYFKPSIKKETVYLVFSCLILFGVVLELIQHQLNSNRTYDTVDMIANCLGVIFGTLIARKLNIIKLK
ncbi:VanZ family protein [Winogradskyella sp. PE311]|uniref:VanZ family protein n=1 Tax=Winogradskyella sp. PE311 TaxID=3366943 RepID=UPI00397FFAE4